MWHTAPVPRRQTFCLQEPLLQGMHNLIANIDGHFRLLDATHGYNLTAGWRGLSVGQLQRVRSGATRLQEQLAKLLPAVRGAVHQPTTHLVGGVRFTSNGPKILSDAAVAAQSEAGASDSCDYVSHPDTVHYLKQNPSVIPRILSEEEYPYPRWAACEDTKNQSFSKEVR